MQCFLKDAYARQCKDARVRIWIRKIEEISNDAKDVLDSFILEVESRRGGNILKVLKRFACVVTECTIRHKLGSKITAIQTRISNLNTRLQTYGLRALPEDPGSLNYVNQRQTQSRRSYSHVDQNDFVGLEEDVENLVECLVNDDHKVVAICGMGGLGKTTLAKKIFYHEKVKSHFQALVWVCMSQRWQIITILQQILVKLTPGDEDIMKEKDTDCLIKKIFDVQQEKKCLVILDDIWHEEAWDMLKAAFPMGDMGGKLLLTSRYMRVVKHVDPNVLVHEPRLLSEDECLMLLKKNAFTMGDDTAVKEKEVLANEIIKECQGLPLAVIVLGGILATKQSLDEWKRVYQSIMSGKGIGQHEGGVSKILDLSYNDLPYQLKPCFLYLGKFKEDAEIETERLYQLWIAESMVLSEDRREGETMMDVAEGYLDELAQRCMVQVQLAEEQREEYGKFKSCRLHDLMRDLSLSNGKEENFFQIFHFQHENNPPNLVESSSSFTSRTQRAVVYLDDENTNSRKFSLDEETSRTLQSLFFYMSEVDEGRGMPRMVKSRLNDFKLLRVLAIERLHNRYIDLDMIEWAKLLPDHLALSKAIGKLIHLIYLSLRGSGFFMIPSFIKNLKHLQTLYLEGDLHSYLPCNANVLRKMRRLQHLYLPTYFSDNLHSVFKPSKLQLDGLSNLETLENFNSSWCDSKGLRKLINLRKLTAYSEDLEEVERIIDYLSSTAAKHMRYSYIFISGGLDFNSEEGRTTLTKILRCGHLTELNIWNGTCKNLPRYDEVLNFSQSLTKVTLMYLYLEEDPMPTLEKLPNLQVLSLEGAFNGKTMVCSENGFPQLRSLDLSGMEYFENWRVEEEAMPKLSKLVLWNCKSLKAVPDGLRFITTLRELVIREMDEEFKRRVKVVDGKEGEDFDKIRHVTSVFID